MSVQSLGPAPHARPRGVSVRWWQPRPHRPPPVMSCEGASVHDGQLWGVSWWRAAGRGRGRGWLQPNVPLSVWELILQGRRCFLRWRGWAGPSTERKLSERGLRDRKTHACQKRREVPGRAGWPRGLEGLELNPEGLPGHLEESGPRPVELRASAPIGRWLCCAFTRMGSGARPGQETAPLAPRARAAAHPCTAHTTPRPALDTHTHVHHTHASHSLHTHSHTAPTRHTTRALCLQ